MLPQKKLLNLPLLGAIALGLLIGLSVSLFAWKRLAKSDPEAQTSKHTIDKPGDALKYWTPERMREAMATNMPHINFPGQGKSGRQHPPQSPRPHKA